MRLYLLRKGFFLDRACLFDLLVVAMDVLTCFTEMMNLKLLSMVPLRILRVLRAMRLVRVQNIIDCEVIVDGDGQTNYEEFVKMMVNKSFSVAADRSELDLVGEDHTKDENLVRMMLGKNVSYGTNAN